MKKIKSILLIMSVLIGSMFILTPVYAEDAATVADPYAICNDLPTSQVCKDKDKSNLMGLVKTGANILLFIIGSIAVIMIIFSGFLYLTSMGDPSNVKKAKDTLLYSIVGLVVALLAGAIVNFVLANFTSNSTGSSTTNTTKTNTTTTESSKSDTSTDTTTTTDSSTGAATDEKSDATGPTVENSQGNR